MMYVKRQKAKIKTRNLRLYVKGLEHIPTVSAKSTGWPHKTNGDEVNAALTRAGYTKDEIDTLVKEGRVMLSCVNKRVAIKPSQELYILEADNILEADK